MSSQQSVSTASRPLPSVRVSAQVVFSILNAFSRRSARDSRVFGTLLGEVTEDGVVNVTECFAVPATENVEENQLVFDVDYHKTMYAFHLRNNRREVVVGWFATTAVDGQLLTDSSSFVQGIYAGECASGAPVHVVVDTTFASGDLDVRAFVSQKNAVADLFREVRCELSFSEAEASLLRHLIHGQKRGEEWAGTTVLSTLPTAQQRLERSVAQLDGVLAQLQQYVDGVVEGKTEGDRELGVALSEALMGGSAAQTQAAALQQLSTRYQDLVMISYLSTLAQSQASVAEKLNQII